MRKYIVIAIIGLLAFAGITTAEAITYSPAADTRARSYGSGTLGAWQTLSHSTSPSGVTGDWSATDGDPVADVGIVGDSITGGAWPSLQSRLTADGRTLAVNYWSGRPIVGSGIVDWILDLPDKPAILVLAMGANDIFNPVGVSAEVNRLRTGLPSTTTLVVVDVYVVRAAQSAAVQFADLRNSGWVNLQLHDACKSPCRLVHWFTYFASAPGRDDMYLRDGVHLINTATAEGFWGQAIYAVID